MVKSYVKSVHILFNSKFGSQRAVSKLLRQMKFEDKPAFLAL